MKLLLPGPFGWASEGELSHVTLERIGGPGPILEWAVTEALLDHSCHRAAIPKILTCLQHSLYQCLMRPNVTAEVVRCGCLRRAGVHVSWRLFGTARGTHRGTVAPQNTP